MKKKIEGNILYIYKLHRTQIEISVGHFHNTHNPAKEKRKRKGKDLRNKEKMGETINEKRKQKRQKGIKHN
jgi:hypothetical protein